MFNRLIEFKTPNFSITGLRIAFRVEKSLVGYPNLAEITIYNLSPSQRDELENAEISIELSAGHEDTGIFLMFSGAISNVVHEYVKPDWQTKIYATDANRAVNNTLINKSLPAGLNSQEIFDELVNELEGVTKGITEGLTDCLTGKKSLLRKLILAGDVKKWLDQLADDCGFDYSVNDGVIETTVRNQPLMDLPPIIINQANYMIEGPVRSEVGVNVKRLLTPQAKLARRFKIEATSEKINVGNLYFRRVPPVRNEGVYRIDKLVHVGDTHADPWYTHFFGRNF